MKTTKTNALLHDVVLEIMFNENQEKAVPLAPEDILWKIDNSEIALRDIKEVLDWLVRQRRVNEHFGKYTMDRFEFLNQKEKKVSENKTGKKIKPLPSTPKKRIQKPKKETFRLNRATIEKTPRIKLSKVLFLLGVLGLLVMSYSYWVLQQEIVYLEKNDELLRIEVPKIKLRSMYLSLKSESNEELFKDVSHSFVREVANNKKLDKKINSLFRITDSIQQNNRRLILNLQKSVNNTVINSNSTFQCLIICNMLFLILISIVYFKS